MKSTTVLAAAFNLSVALASPTEEYTCSYTWVGERGNHPMLIALEDSNAVVRGGPLNFKFRIVENSATELIMIEPHTKASSGKDYPVGATLVVVDKATNRLVRSNTYADSKFNKYGYGTCQRVRR